MARHVDGPLPESNPTESWWLDRETFYQKAKENLARMRRSKFGQMEVNTTSAGRVINARAEVSE